MAKRNKQASEQQRQWELPAGSHVWVYLRHSPGDGQTIDSQKHGMLEWCADLGVFLDQMWIDEGVEGSKEEREQFQAMIAAARQVPRPVDGILLWSFSRFARSQLDAQLYKATLRKQGYVVMSKIDDVPNNELAPIFESVIDWKNQRFLDDLSADVKRGQVYLVERGYLPGSTPAFGYRFELGEIGQRRNGEVRYANRLVKDEAIADRVALAWQMKMGTNASYRDIQQVTHLFANERSYSRFFSNLIFAGIMVYNGKRYPLDWEHGARFCEPYVTLEQFAQVQQGRKRRTIDVIAPRSLSSTYLLTGLLYCGFCEEHGKSSRMSGGKQYQGEHRYYRCTDRVNGLSLICPMGHVACWKIDDAVLQVLKESVLTPDYITSEVEQANARLLTKGADVRTQVRQAEQILKEQERRVEGVVKLIEKKGLTTILERQYDEANAAWLEATRQLALLRSESLQSQVRQIALADAQRCLDDLVNILDVGTVRQKQELVRRFVERVVVYDGHMYIKLQFNWDTFMSEHSIGFPPSNKSYGNSSHHRMNDA